MSHIYRSEATVGAITFTEPGVGQAVPEIWFSAGDDHATWAIRAYMEYEETPLFSAHFENRAKFEFLFGGGHDPGLYSFVSGTFFLYAGAGDNGAAFLSGFTLAIEKDEVANQIRFVTPLGTSIHVLSGFETPDDTKLRADTMAHQLVRTNPTASMQMDEDWTSFYSKQDGVNFLGAALTSAAPGIWSDWFDVTSGSPPMHNHDAQGASSYHTGLQRDYPADNALTNNNRRYRYWTGGDTVDATSAGDAESSDASADHGFVATAYVLPTSRDTVRCRIDTGDTTNGPLDTAVYLLAGTHNSSPSVHWAADRLRVVWHNGTSILQADTRDLGATWSTPVALSVAGTNPSTVISPDHGLWWLFYCSGGNLLVVGSGDYGTTVGSPATVAMAVTPQTVGAAITADGTLVVTYLAGSSIVQVKSRDSGQSWS